MAVLAPPPAALSTALDAETLRLVALAFVPAILFALFLLVRPQPVQRLSGRMSRWQLDRMAALGAPRVLRDHAAWQARVMAGPAGLVILRVTGAVALTGILGALYALGLRP